jgi:hypothetical protein
MMNDLVTKLRQPLVDKMKAKRREEKQARRDERAKRRKEIQQKKDKDEQLKRTNPAQWAAQQKKLKEKQKEDFEFRQPPLLGLVTRLFRGVKYDIKNIHIRYEDDIFSAGSPYAFGFTIHHIKMDNHVEEEQRQRALE